MKMQKPEKTYVDNHQICMVANEYQAAPFQARLYQLGRTNLYQWYIRGGVFWEPWGDIMELIGAKK